MSLSSHPARRRVLDDLAKAGGTPPPLVRDGTLRVALLPENAPLEVPPPPLEHREAADGGCPSGEVALPPRRMAQWRHAGAGSGRAGGVADRDAGGRWCRRTARTGASGRWRGT